MENNINGKSFIMYTSWKGLFASLPPDQCIGLLIAIFEYAESEKEPDFSAFGEMGKILNGIFGIIRGALDANKERYKKTSEKRAIAGRKGGLAYRKNEAKEAKEANASKSKQKKQLLANASKSKHNDNENENDNDNENENENDNENENENEPFRPLIESILSAYPEKERQETAYYVIEKRIKEGEDPEQLLNAAKMYALDLEMKEPGTKKILPDNFYKENGVYLSYKNKNPDEIRQRARKRESEKRQPTNKKIPFQNFEQRPYDYKALEAQLLGGPNQGAPNIKRGPGIDYT